jgi:hypothetical protein
MAYTTATIDPVLEHFLQHRPTEATATDYTSLNGNGFTAAGVEDDLHTPLISAAPAALDAALKKTLTDYFNDISRSDATLYKTLKAYIKNNYKPATSSAKATATFKSEAPRSAATLCQLFINLFNAENRSQTFSYGIGAFAIAAPTILQYFFPAYAKLGISGLSVLASLISTLMNLILSIKIMGKDIGDFTKAFWLAITEFTATMTREGVKPAAREAFDKHLQPAKWTAAAQAHVRAYPGVDIGDPTAAASSATAAEAPATSSSGSQFAEIFNWSMPLLRGLGTIIGPTAATLLAQTFFKSTKIAVENSHLLGYSTAIASLNYWLFGVNVILYCIDLLRKIYAAASKSSADTVIAKIIEDN